MQRKKDPKILELSMAGVPGFEPGRCQIQSLMPYHLAIPQFTYSLYNNKYKISILLMIKFLNFI